VDFCLNRNKQDMSLSQSTVSSIELVHSEIDATIQQAETSLERFQENRDSSEELQNCIDCLNQLRGIFVVIEVQGCVLLCQEAVALANEVPVGANSDKNDLLSSLSNAIFILRRYTEYFNSKKNDHPELLLPIINELRLARKAKPYPESHFFDFDNALQFDLSTVVDLSAGKTLSDFEHHARRFRLMYQVGLLDILRDRNLSIAFRLLKRAAEGSARLSHCHALSQFWLLVALVCEALSAQVDEVSITRKRLFMKVERYLREMTMLGKVALSKQAPDSLRRELLYVLSLSGQENETARLVLAGFGVRDYSLSDVVLREESRKLFGPGVDVLRSLSKAIHEELAQIKDKLDILERGSGAEAEDVEFLAKGFGRLAGTLRMLDLDRIAELTHQQISIVEGWSINGTPVPEAALADLADATLSVEQAIRYFEETGQQPEESVLHQPRKRENSYLAEARIVVVDESQAGLSLAKRAISSFLESSGDRMHLANIGPVLDSVRGAMILIGQERAASVVMNLLSCINAELFEREEMPSERLLETIADAISSVEYFIESMQYSNSQNQSLLKIAEDSLASIGYH
jgi:hypothetical protein